MGGIVVLAISSILAIGAVYLLSKGIGSNLVRKNMEKYGVMTAARIVQVKMVRKKCGLPYVNKYYYAKAYPIVAYTVDNKQYVETCKDIVYDCDLPIYCAGFEAEDNFKQHFGKQVQIIYDKKNPEQILSINSLEAGSFNDQIKEGLVLLIVSLVLNVIACFLPNSAFNLMLGIGMLLYFAYYLWQYSREKKEQQLIKTYGERVEATIIDVDVCCKVKAERPCVIIGVPIFQYEVKGIQHYARCCQLKKQHTLRYGRYQGEIADKKYFEKSIGEKIDIRCLANDPSKYSCSINQDDSLIRLAEKVVPVFTLCLSVAAASNVGGTRLKARLQQTQKTVSKAPRQEGSFTASTAQQKEEDRYISLSYCRIASTKEEAPAEYLFMGIVMDLSSEQLAAKKSYHITAEIDDGNGQAVADGISSPDQNELHSDGQAVAQLLFPYDKIEAHKGPYSLHIQLEDNNKVTAEEKSIKLDQDFFNNKASSGAQAVKID